MVEIVDCEERLRKESYEHINELLQPRFFLQSMGTSSFIYKGSCPRVMIGKGDRICCQLVGQRDNIRSYPIGELFLYWDNVKVTIKGHPDVFYDVGVELEKHGYRVNIEV